jgi:hypothetical protein
MPADEQARYDVMVAETQRMAREVAEMAYDLNVARGENAALRRALGLHAPALREPKRTMG